MARRIDRDYHDLGLLDIATVVGDDGSIAWQGRLASNPRSLQEGHTISPEFVGPMVEARRRKVPVLIVDRDVSGWSEAPLWRRVEIASSGTGQGKIPASVANGGLSWDFPNEAMGTEITELWYRAFSGAKVSRIDYRGTLAGTTSDIETSTLFVTDGEAAGFSSESHGLTLDNTMRTVTLATPRRQAFLRACVTGSITPAAGTRRSFDRMATYGEHTVPLQALTDEPAGVYAADVIRYLVSTYCPRLNTNGVRDTTYPIRHLSPGRVFPHDAFLEVNKFHNWELAAWEDFTVHYEPADLTDYDWEVRLSEGAKVNLQGDSTDDLANGIAVTFQNVVTGYEEVVTPDEYAELRDESVENPANRHGDQLWAEITLTAPTTTEDALQAGRIALAEFNAPKGVGTITAQGYIRDRAGHWQQYWKPRAGETVAITDHPNDRPRLIGEVEWDDMSKTVTIAVDSTLPRLEAIQHRQDVALQAAGLV